MTITADILTAAGVLVATSWTQDCFAANAAGEPVDPESPDAVAFGALGAIHRATVDSFDRPDDIQTFGGVVGRQRVAQALVAQALQADGLGNDWAAQPSAAITEWNNAADRTAEDVCDVLNAAADAARAT